MSIGEMISKIEELKELQALIREAEAEAERLENEIKAEMLKAEAEEMNVGRYIVRWTSVTSNRFDTKIFKTAMPDVYEMYVKPSHSKKFSITG